MMTTWLNYTPHNVVIKTAEGSMIIASRGVARLAEKLAVVGSKEFTTVEVAFSAIEGLPDDYDVAYNDIMFIVSSAVLDAAANYDNLCAPYTGTHADFGPVRNAEGQVTAVRALRVRTS